MKHCPQCEFTFDDQQQVCDFDGTELRVIPEAPLPSFKHASLMPTAHLSFVRRLVQSRAGLAALTLAGLLLSALLIGYFDSVDQASFDESNSQMRQDTAGMVPSAQADQARPAETQVNRPTVISTQRKIGADELPPSTVRRLREGSRLQSAKSVRSRSTNRQVATKRGPSRSRLVAIKRKAERAKRQSQARNQSRLNSADRDRRQHSAASVTTRRPSWNTNQRSADQRRASSQTAYNRNGERSANDSAHRRKDGKVIAILKKTGGILKRPFEFIAGR